MVNLIEFIKSTLGLATKIKTVYSLTALAILCVFALGIYMLVAPTPSTSTSGVVMFLVGGLLIVCIVLARKIPASTSEVPQEEPEDSTLVRTNLSVSNKTWEDISHSLKQLTFNTFSREKKFCLIDNEYYLSWAESRKGTKLPFIQLEPNELIVSNLRKINTIMALEIPTCLKISGLIGYVIVCETDVLKDVCYEYVASLRDQPRCFLLSNSTITQLKRRDDIAITTLKAKLASCIP